MAYDFPASPSEDQEYTPPGAPQTYVYKAPRWLVKGSPATDWDSIPGKPATFPPTLPIAESGVTNLVADLAGKAPTVHAHVQSDVTGLPAALTGKEPTIAAGTAAQYWRGDKSWQALDKTSVGLSNVDNTSDANAPVSTAQAAAIALKADIAGATFTGKVTFPAQGVTGGLNVTPGAGNPSGPADGDVWTTGGNFGYRVGGANHFVANLTQTQTFTAAKTFSLIITGTLGVKAYAATATPAGGTAGAGFTLSSTTNFGVFFGSGVPTLSAAKGSHYLRSDGGVGTYTYVNTDGATTWASLLDDGAGVLKAGDTMTGDLRINMTAPSINIDKVAANESAINFRTGTANRWRWVCDNSAESAGNGSHLRLHRCNDAGTKIDEPIVLNRSTGAATFISVSSGTTMSAVGSVRANNATAIPAGGTTGAGLLVSSATNFGIFFGSGVPTLSAAKGSLYLRSDGGTTNDRMYVNTNGTTGWAAVTTAS